MKTLALRTKASNGVKPPATKRELIEAMAIVKQKQLTDENCAREARAENLKTELEGALITLVNSTFAKQPNVSANLGYCYRGEGEIKNIHVEVSLPLENLPKGIQKKLAEYHEVSNRKPIPSLTDIRREISVKMAGQTPVNLRVQTLVETPDSRKALERMLGAIEGENEPAAIEV
jgi:hypothetical protein